MSELQAAFANHRRLFVLSDRCSITAAVMYTIGHRPVVYPPAVPRTFRRLLALRVRAATNASQHVSQTPPPLKPADRSLTALMSQVVTQIGDWWTPTKADVAEESDIMTVDELTKHLKEELQQQPETEAAKTATTRPNIWKFLKPASLEEVQNSRIMASLANASYYISRIQFKTLLQKSGFHLVTTSLKCKQPATNAKLMDEALMAGDGMAVNVTVDSPPREESAPASGAASNIVTAASLHRAESPGETVPSGWTAALNVGSVAGSIYSQTLSQLARQVTFAATVSQTAVADTVTRVMKLLQVAMRVTGGAPKMKESIPKEAQQGSVPVEVMNKCPTEWFVCDDKKKNTRVFCIQGTDSFESWQTNLKFVPVPFEDEGSGVRVHSGIYEAAQGLYSLFVPLIRDYVESGSRKKISFAGHSLGGAIASVLMMMLVYRGELPVEHVGQVLTFGAAASFCDSTDCQSCGLKDVCPAAHDKTASHPSLLKRLGLPENTIVNVIMHKDIVPRAFACDYSLVADLLRKWSHSFRKHHCLTISGRSLLYNFIGEVHVLQPSEHCHYVQNEGYHPMLPQEASLLKIVDPDPKQRERGMKQTDGIEVDNKREAFLALMDNPHPLDMLADARAYGVHGAISRYHNPLNYATGLRSILSDRKSSPHIFGLPLTPPQLPF